MATLFRATGIELKIKPANKIDGFSADEISSLIGPLLQILPLGSDRIMLTSSSPSEPMRKNVAATRLFLNARSTREAPAREIDVIHGDVIVAEHNELNIVAFSGLLFT